MNIADMLIHVHPELGPHEKTELARSLEHNIGVDCAAFSYHPRSHSLLVKYDPEALTGKEILEMVRRLDPEASMVGL
jgi:hypothetical protein